MTKEWLVDYRNKANMTHAVVASMSGIQRAYYTQIENGSRHPSVSVAKRIANVLGFDWTIFFEQDCSESRHVTNKCSAHVV